MIPRVGVSGVTRMWDGAERAGVNAAYVRAVLNAGGAPIILSPLLDERYAARATDGLDALILTGGEDVDPAHYGAAPSPHLQTVDAQRDRFELAIFASARARGIPVLGICRGIQVINVALGGTLWQDLPTERPGPTAHDPGAARDARTHAIRVAPETRAAAALGRTELTVNSFHHQAVRQLAPGLTATAWSPDGLIEAVEGSDQAPWLLAVQWHPEEMHADAVAPEQGLFRAVVEEARAAGVRLASLRDRGVPA